MPQSKQLANQGTRTLKWITDRVFEEEVSHCWIWQGAKWETSVDVIGREKIDYTQPHKLAYWLATGVQGETIWQNCGERKCCNPAHLESISYAEYMRRSQMH